MRYKIWEKDDFFETGGKRIDMDPSVVELPLEAPLTWQFYWTGAPTGKVTEIRVEDGEITCEVEIFDKAFSENAKNMMDDKGIRLGGYYKDVYYVDETETSVKSARLAGVSLVPHTQIPKVKGMTNEKEAK